MARSIDLFQSPEHNCLTLYLFKMRKLGGLINVIAKAYESSFFFGMSLKTSNELN